MSSLGKNRKSGLRINFRVAALALFLMQSALAPQSGAAQTFSVPYTFQGSPIGEFPYAGVAIDRAGNLYGTTSEFGDNADGTVYKLPVSFDYHVVDLLYNFPSHNNEFPGGAFPFGGVTFGPDGSLYGTTEGYGMGGNPSGTVFKLQPPLTICKSITCPWTETVLYTFQGGSDGAHPYYGEVAFDQTGNIYGTTRLGGQYGEGTVYELTHSGNTWTDTVLHSFGGIGDGKFPMHNVIFDRMGNLYGTTHGNGNGNYGTVFQLVPTGSGWTENVLYSFSGTGSAGIFPSAGLIIDQSGNLYGATSGEGTNGAGTVFELTPTGGTWAFTILYALSGSISDGPVGNLVIDNNGDLFGAAAGLTLGSHGWVFELIPSNGGWTYVDLHDFSGGADGAEPLSDLTLDAQGNLFGTASLGGVMGACGGGGCGVVWEITF
jgi:uncharacterized repeat protein (TIGR03803 family)